MKYFHQVGVVVAAVFFALTSLSTDAYADVVIHSSNSNSTTLNGETIMSTMTQNAMSSRSSSIRQSDGSRDDKREVHLANDDWSVVVSSIDHITSDAAISSHRLTIGVDDKNGKHMVVPGRPYTAADGTQFTATGDGVHIVQMHGDNYRQVTDVERENTGGRWSRLRVNQYSCQGDHC